MSVDHYENFPVASVLCPPAIRPAVVAIYHFARTADDIADEGTASPSERLLCLHDYGADLRAIYSGQAPSGRWSAIFGSLDRARQTYNLPQQPLADLLDAFAQDTGNPAYANREVLLDYCRRSANPIGRLLMHLYAILDTRSLAQSDAICSALQLINFWQDLSADLPRGRVYLPLADAQACGVDLSQPASLRDSAATQMLISQLCGWAQGLMEQGAPLALSVPGRAGWELRLVVQGGLRILEKIRQMQHRTVQQRPRLRAWDIPLLLWRALNMRSPAKLAGALS